MSEAPPRADSGGAGTGGHGRVLAYTRRGKSDGHGSKPASLSTGGATIRERSFSARSAAAKSAGRGDTLTAPDAPRDAGTGMARGALSTPCRRPLRQTAEPVWGIRRHPSTGQAERILRLPLSRHHRLSRGHRL